MDYIKTNTWKKGMILFCLLTVCLITLILSQTAFAASDSGSVTLEVNQTFTQFGNPADVNSVFSYKLVSLENGNPMPSGSSGGIHDFTVAGTGATNIGPITYTNTGIYNYRIEADTSSKAAGYIYDEQIYTVSVYVRRDGEDLATVTTVKKNTGEKVGTIAFEHKYHPQQHSLTYNANGGTGVVIDPKSPYNTGSNVTVLDKSQMKKDGYRFDGWNTDRDGFGTAYVPDDKFVITEDTVLYAQWKKSALRMHPHYAYIIGYSNGRVYPEKNITRAEAATIFFRTLTQKARTEIWSKINSYKDVNTMAWYNNAISTLTNGSFLKGYDDGTFGPGKYITRAEFAAMAVRISGEVSGTTGASYTDIEGHWAEVYIKKATVLGYVEGYPDGSFCPDNPITRAEVAALINRVIKRQVESEEDMLDGMITWPDNTPDKWYYLDILEATNSHTAEEKSDGVHEIWLEFRNTPDWRALEKPDSMPGDVNFLAQQMFIVQTQQIPEETAALYTLGEVSSQFVEARIKYWETH